MFTSIIKINLHIIVTYSKLIHPTFMKECTKLCCSELSFILLGPISQRVTINRKIDINRSSMANRVLRKLAINRKPLWCKISQKLLFRLYSSFIIWFALQGARLNSFSLSMMNKDIHTPCILIPTTTIKAEPAQVIKAFSVVWWSDACLISRQGVGSILTQIRMWQYFMATWTDII